MSIPPRIGTLWIDGALRWIEQLCLASFVAQGHEVTLFSYGNVTGAPQGVAVRDAREVFDCPQDILAQCPAAYVADVFRLYLVRDTDMVWVDTDAYCLSPFMRDAAGYVLGLVPEGPFVNNGVIGAPGASAAVNQMIALFEEDAAIPEWLTPRRKKQLARLAPEERRIRRPQIHRTIFGPHGLTHLLGKSGEIAHARPPKVLFPIPWHSVDLLFNPHGGVEGWVDDGTLSVHFYTSSIRFWHLNRRVPEGSYMRFLMDRIGFHRDRQRRAS